MRNRKPVIGRLKPTASAKGKSYLGRTLREYFDDLAAKKPAPGGGSAAALTGALGCGLLSMACNFTIGKDKYKKVEPRIKELLKQSERLRKRMMALVDLDIKAYQRVSRAPKSNPGLYQKILKAATYVPFEICLCAVEAYKLCPELAKIGNKRLVSDVYAGRELLKSCFKSARFNVIINIPHVEDKKFIHQIKSKISRLKKSI